MPKETKPVEPVATIQVTGRLTSSEIINECVKANILCGLTFKDGELVGIDLGAGQIDLHAVGPIYGDHVRIISRLQSERETYPNWPNPEPESDVKHV